MKNKCGSKLSFVLISENFKMYWYIPVLSFLIYFFSGIFPLLVNRNVFNPISNYTVASFINSSMIFIPLMILVPLVAATTVMGFLHKENLALVIHSQPFSKEKLHLSQWMSGWLMCILPIILTGILFLCVLPTTISLNDGGSTLSLSCVIKWLADELAIITFFYCLYIFAGSLVGTAIMQVLLSGIFFGIVPLILWLVDVYCDNFLIGYSEMPTALQEILTHSNPIILMISQTYDETSFLGISCFLLYLGLGLLFMGFSWYAYKKAKLEKVGDSMLFPIVSEIITYLIVFVGMTSAAFLLYSLVEETLFIFFTGAFFGAVITYFVVKIIIAKSVKVFTLKNLISFGIYLVITLVFFSFTIFDITNFKVRMPDKADIASVSIQQYDAYNLVYGCYFVDSDCPLELRNYSKKNVTDPEFILDMLALQTALIQSSSIEPSTEEALGWIPYATFTYNLKNGKTYSREYTSAIDEPSKQLLEKVWSSPEYYDTITLGDNLSKVELLNASMTIDTVGKGTYQTEEYYKIEAADDVPQTAVLQVNDEKQIRDFIDAYDKDLLDSATYETKLSNRAAVREGTETNSILYTCSVSITYENPENNKMKTGSLSFDVYEEDANTLKLINQLKK